MLELEEGSLLICVTKTDCTKDEILKLFYNLNQQTCLSSLIKTWQKVILSWEARQLQVSLTLRRRLTATQSLCVAQHLVL